MFTVEARRGEGPWMVWKRLLMTREAVEAIAARDAACTPGWTFRVVVEHTQDADCTVRGGVCVICYVDHTGECRECHGRGFHRPGCGDFEG